MSAPPAPPSLTPRGIVFSVSRIGTEITIAVPLKAIDPPYELSLSQEVKDLCDELTARRSGAARPASSANATAGKNKSRSGDDFWGGGGGGGGGSANRGAAGSAPARSGRGGQGKQDGKQQQQQQQQSQKATGTVYQKAAAEDFWGGGTKSGRSTSATKSAPASAPPSAALPNQAVRNPPPAAALASTNIGSKGKGKKGGGKLPASKPKATATAVAANNKRPTQPPPPPPTTKPSVNSVTKGGGKVGAGFPSGGGGAAGGVASKPEKAPEWSGVTCQCMGTKHDLVTNCTTCGKIACVVEGGFGCSFCGSTLPATGREPRRGSANGSGSGPIKSTAEEEGNGGGLQSAALKEALARKDKLLLFDRTSASRTRVLDDQGDYFTSHNWLSQKERAEGEAEEKSRRDDAAERRGARREVKLSMDIMGRRVVETKQQTDDYRGATPGNDDSKQEDENGTTTAAADAVTEGVSFDFGSTRAASGTGRATAAGSAGQEEVIAASEATAGSRRGTISLENTGLRGRAKVVYDVMRANLEKQGRRRPAGAAVKKKGAVGADQSRVSLWRVQHDIDSDDFLQQERQNNRKRDSASPDGFQKFEPADELPCGSG